MARLLAGSKLFDLVFIVIAWLVAVVAFNLLLLRLPLTVFSSSSSCSLSSSDGEGGFSTSSYIIIVASMSTLSGTTSFCIAVGVIVDVSVDRDVISVAPEDGIDAKEPVLEATAEGVEVDDDDDGAADDNDDRGVLNVAPSVPRPLMLLIC